MWKKYFSPGVLQSGTWEFNPVGSWLRTQGGVWSLGTHLGQGSTRSLHNHHQAPVASQALGRGHPSSKLGLDHTGCRKPQLCLRDGGKTPQLYHFPAMTNTDKTSFLWSRLTDPESFKEPSACKAKSPAQLPFVVTKAPIFIGFSRCNVFWTM